MRKKYVAGWRSKIVAEEQKWKTIYLNDPLLDRMWTGMKNFSNDEFTPSLNSRAVFFFFFYLFIALARLDPFRKCCWWRCTTRVGGERGSQKYTNRFMWQTRVAVAQTRALTSEPRESERGLSKDIVPATSERRERYKMLVGLHKDIQTVFGYFFFLLREHIDQEVENDVRVVCASYPRNTNLPLRSLQLLPDGESPRCRSLTPNP